MSNIFFCKNDPQDKDDYDPEGRVTGWYYLTRGGVPVGPFSSAPQAEYASARGLPAPAKIGPVVDHITY